MILPLQTWDRRGWEEPDDRVVVTGLGAISACGPGVPSFWKQVVAGTSALSRLTWPDGEAIDVHVGGTVPGFAPARAIPAHLKPQRLSRQTQLALAAAIEAVADARLGKGDGIPRIGVYVGASTSSVDTIRRSVVSVIKGGAARAHPSLIPSSPPGASTGAIAGWLADFGWASQGFTLSTACAAGLDAVGHAYQAIRTGHLTIALAGGCDAPLTICPLAEFVAAGLANTETDPSTASRPFDATRLTGVLAEGAGIVVLESLTHALARGARIYAEITGFAQHMDRRRETPGDGIAPALDEALAEARLQPRELDYICAWGPGHPVIDREEVAAVKEAIGLPAATTLAVSSIKGVIGNPLAASGPLQIIASCLALRHAIVPPTANLHHPDPACDLDHVPLRARRQWIRSVACNAHGIGGGNSSLILQAPDLPSSLSYRS